MKKMKKKVVKDLKHDMKTMKKEVKEDKELLHKLKHDKKEVKAKKKEHKPKKKMTKGKAKVEKVMHEFKEGKLHSGSKKGPEVKNPKQAIAIALSEARRAGAKVPKKKK